MTRLYRFKGSKFGCFAIPLDENGAPIGVALGYEDDLLPDEGRGRLCSHIKHNFEKSAVDGQVMEIQKLLNVVSTE